MPTSEIAMCSAFSHSAGKPVQCGVSQREIGEVGKEQNRQARPALRTMIYSRPGVILNDT